MLTIRLCRGSFAGEGTRGGNERSGRQRAVGGEEAIFSKSHPSGLGRRNEGSELSDAELKWKSSVRDCGQSSPISG